MSELAHRRYMNAKTIAESSPKDALEAVLWELQDPEDATQHVIIIRASYTPEGLDYNISQAGTFNIAERMGLMALVSSRIIGN